MSEPRKLVFDPISGEVRDKVTMALVGFLEGKEPKAPSPSEEQEQQQQPTSEPEHRESEESEGQKEQEDSEQSEGNEEGEKIKPEEDIPAPPPESYRIKDIEYNVPSGERRRNIYDPRNWYIFKDENTLKRWDKDKWNRFREVVDIQFKRSCEQYEELKNKMDTDAWSRNKLKSILKDNSSKREIGNKEYGLLDLKKLHKIVTTGKVFKRKALITDKKYSVSLLVDCSGSMRHSDKNIHAAMATVKFILEYGEYVDIDAIGFNREIITLKSFGEPVSKRMLQEIFFLITSPASCYDLVNSFLDTSSRIGELSAAGNHDHMALMYGEKKLLGRNGQKFMVVFSDGAPSCDEEGNCRICRGSTTKENLIKETKRIESTDIKLFSIGVKSESVSRFYKNFKIISDVSALSRTLIDLIGSQIKRMTVRG